VDQRKTLRATRYPGKISYVDNERQLSIIPTLPVGRSGL